MHPQDVQVLLSLQGNVNQSCSATAADQISAMWSRPGKTWSRFPFINKAIYQAQGSRVRLRIFFPQRLCFWYLRHMRTKKETSSGDRMRLCGSRGSRWRPVYFVQQRHRLLVVLTTRPVFVTAARLSSPCPSDCRSVRRLYCMLLLLSLANILKSPTGDGCCCKSTGIYLNQVVKLIATISWSAH